MPVIRYVGPLIAIIAWGWVFLSLASDGYALAEERQSRVTAEAHVVALQTQVARLTPTATPCNPGVFTPNCGVP